MRTSIKLLASLCLLFGLSNAFADSPLMNLVKVVNNYPFDIAYNVNNGGFNTCETGIFQAHSTSFLNLNGIKAECTRDHYNGGDLYNVVMHGAGNAYGDHSGLFYLTSEGIKLYTINQGSDPGKIMGQIMDDRTLILDALK